MGYKMHISLTLLDYGYYLISDACLYIGYVPLHIYLAQLWIIDVYELCLLYKQLVRNYIPRYILLSLMDYVFFCYTYT
jgi:hypothetical protein